MTRFISFFAGRTVMVNLFFVVLVAAGIWTALGMPVEEYPNVSFDQAVISVLRLGASPGEMDEEIVKKIVDEVDDVNGIDWIKTTAQNDRASVMIKFKETTPDIERAFRDLQTELDKVADLPEDLDVEPTIIRIDLDEIYPTVLLSVSGDYPNEVLVKIAEALREEVRRVPGVARVSLSGEKQSELRVLASRRALVRHGLTLADLGRALEGRNANVPGGSMDSRGTEFSLRTVGRVEKGSRLMDTIVRFDPKGRHVRLSDVARLESNYKKDIVLVHTDGRESIVLQVVKEPSGNSLNIVPRVRAIARRWRESVVPPGVSVRAFQDTSKRIRDRMGLLLRNMAFGAVLVLVLLWAFLGFRNAILAIIGIPFSLLVAFMLMRAGGDSLNTIALFAFILVSGIIVDDAIVVLENVYRHFESGKPLLRAVVEGAAEVAVPVISATMTTVAAFLPLLLMTGSTGKFFAIIPRAVTYALVASLLECIVILPAHVLHFGPRRIRLTRGARAAGRLREVYMRALGACLRRRWALLGATLAVSLTAGLALLVLPRELFPSDYQAFFVNVHMPAATSLKRTDEVLATIDGYIASFPENEVECRSDTVGMYFDQNYQPRTESRHGQILVTLADPSDPDPARRRTRDTAEIRGAVRRLVEERARRDGLGVESIEVLELADGPPTGRPVTVRVTGDNWRAVRDAARQVRAFVASLGGVVDVTSDFAYGNPQARLEIRRAAAARHGLDETALGAALGAAVEGTVVSEFQRKGTDVDVRVMLAEEDRNDIADLARIGVRSNASPRALVQLGDLADFTLTRQPSAVRRFGRKYAVTITADIEKPESVSLGELPARAWTLFTGESTGRVRTPADVTRAVSARFHNISARWGGVRLDFAGEFEETERSFESLLRSFLIALLLVYLILGAQFRSFLQPLVVMLTVPFAFIGVAMGLLLAGLPFTMTSGVAVVGLAGLVVNDSLILIDFINQRRRSGTALTPAVLDGCRDRVRAIMLTTITTVAGLLPMALGVGGHSKVWGPFATSIVFGLSSATFLTLFVVPVVYLVLESVKQRLGLGPAPADNPTTAADAAGSAT